MCHLAHKRDGLQQDTMGQSSRELNKAYWQGTPANAASASSAAVESASTPKSGSPAPGSSGSAWRMTKLKRTYEAAEEEGRSIEDVAMERYGSLEAFEDAKEERRVLDERGDRRKSRRSESGFGHGGTPAGARTPTGMTADGGGRRFVFTDMEATPGSGGGGDRPMSASRQSFRRPGETPPAMPPARALPRRSQEVPAEEVPRPAPDLLRRSLRSLRPPSRGGLLPPCRNRPSSLPIRLLPARPLQLLTMAARMSCLNPS